MKANVVFKGIIRGVFSECQAEKLDVQPVMTYSGNTVEEVLDGLAIDEWVFVLKVNGKRIKNVREYLKRKGLRYEDYCRAG